MFSPQNYVNTLTTLSNVKVKTILEVRNIIFLIPAFNQANIFLCVFKHTHTPTKKKTYKEGKLNMHTITILWILTVSNTSWKIFENLPVSACIWESACIQPGISAPITVIQQSPQCISCIFVNVSSLFICLFPFGNGWVKWTQEAILFSPGFWHLQFLHFQVDHKHQAKC